MTTRTRFTRDLVVLLLASVCARAESAHSRGAQPSPAAAANPEPRTPERVLGDYRAFVSRLRSAEPATRVVFVSIKPSPSRRAYMDRARVDVFTPMLGPTGQPRPELFMADSLHMTRAGYLLWRTLLRTEIVAR